MFKEEKEQILHIQARNVQGNIPYKALDNFIAAGGDLHLQNDEGKTPLLIAYEHGNVKMVEYLIAKGASTVEVFQSIGKIPSKAIRALLYKQKMEQEINKEYFVGQKSIIRTLLSDNEGDLSCFNKVLVAPNGSGKRHFVGLLENTTGRERIVIKAEDILKVGDLAGILCEIVSPKIVIFEDAHLIQNEQILKAIKNAVEKSQIIVQIGNGSNARSMVIDITPNNYLFCFDSKVLVPEWLNQIKIGQIIFEEYAEEEILTIIANEDVIKGYNSSPKELQDIVIESKGNPRLALGYLRATKDKENVLKGKVEKKENEKKKAEEDRKKIKDMEDEMAGLRDEVSALEKEIDSKEEECTRLNEEKAEKEALLNKMTVRQKHSEGKTSNDIEAHWEEKANQKESKKKEELSHSPLMQARQQIKKDTIDSDKEQDKKLAKEKEEDIKVRTTEQAYVKQEPERRSREEKLKTEMVYQNEGKCKLLNKENNSTKIDCKEKSANPSLEDIFYIKKAITQSSEERFWDKLLIKSNRKILMTVFGEGVFSRKQDIHQHLPQYIEKRKINIDDFCCLLITGEDRYCDWNSNDFWLFVDRMPQKQESTKKLSNEVIKRPSFDDISAMKRIITKSTEEDLVDNLLSKANKKALEHAFGEKVAIRNQDIHYYLPIYIQKRRIDLEDFCCFLITGEKKFCTWDMKDFWTFVEKSPANPEKVKQEALKIKKIFTDAKLITSFVKEAGVIGFFISIFGSEFKSKLTYYSRLIFAYVKDNPADAILLYHVLASLKNKKNGESVWMESILGMWEVHSIKNYKKQFLFNEVKKFIKQNRDERYSAEDIRQDGNFFSNDGKTFYKIVSKFGDRTTTIKKVSSIDRGRIECNGQEYSPPKNSDKKVIDKFLEDFIRKEKLIDVTELVLEYVN